VLVLLMGLMFLFRDFNKPRVQMLHGADIVGSRAAGVPGVGIVGLIGLLRLEKE
jgi:hypothetical protein